MLVVPIVDLVGVPKIVERWASWRSGYADLLLRWRYKA